MKSTTTVVIGAGHAGLAISRCLTERSIDHVILERGEVANSWSTERWDSLRLLTPNWQTRLPGQGYEGADPDGFMASAEVVDFVQRYARKVEAPVQTQTTVTAVRRGDDGYVVATDRGDWRCRAVVLASGANNLAQVPAVAAAVPDSIECFTPGRAGGARATQYRNAAGLPEGGVLVVGASATGAQLADEIQRSGRQVTLAVGEHVRMPRSYRGRDVMWWMEASGVWNERYDQMDDLERARGVPSPQLVGTPERYTLDLNALADRGVRLVGRLAGIRDGRAQFSGSLRNQCALADLKLERLLDTFDEWAGRSADGAPTEPPHRLEPTRVPATPTLGLDLGSGEIRSIVWATGFRPDYSWLDVPVLDRRGRLRHEGGVVDSPGMYVMGLPLQRRRKSSFINGAEDDARDLTAHLAGHLAGSRPATPVRVFPQPAAASTPSALPELHAKAS